MNVTPQVPKWVGFIAYFGGVLLVLQGGDHPYVYLSLVNLSSTSMGPTYFLLILFTIGYTLSIVGQNVIPNETLNASGV